MHKKELLAYQIARQIIRADSQCELESAISTLHRLVIKENVTLRHEQMNITKKLISLLFFEENSPLKSHNAIYKAIDLSAKYLSLNLANNLANSLMFSTDEKILENCLYLLENVRKFQNKESFMEIIKTIKIQIAYLTGIRTSYTKSELANKALELLMHMETDDVFGAISIILNRQNNDYKNILGWISTLNKLVLIYQSDYFMQENNQMKLQTLREIREELISIYYYLYPSLKNHYYNKADYLSTLKYIDANQFLNEIEYEKNKDLKSQIKNSGTYMITVKVREGIYKIDEIIDLSVKYKKFRKSLEQKRNQKINKKCMQRKNKL